MAPKLAAKKAAAKQKARNVASNGRSLGRRRAVKLLNGLAAELGVRQVPVKVRPVVSKLSCGSWSTGAKQVSTRSA